MNTTYALNHTNPHNVSALSQLFARYISGQITERTWNQFTEIFDTVDATPQERMAFAGFINDAIDEQGRGDITVPKADELQTLLSQARAA